MTHSHPSNLFQWRADQLIATLLSEFDPTSESYWFNENKIVKKQYKKLRSAQELKDPEDVLIPISLRLTRLTDDIKIQAKQLTLYHPIGDEINKYYEDRFNAAAGNFIDVLQDFYITKRHLDPCPTFHDIGSEIHIRDDEAGFNYSDIYDKINDYIVRLRELSQEK
jgi:hypothetical protein